MRFWPDLAARVSLGLAFVAVAWWAMGEWGWVPAPSEAVVPLFFLPLTATVFLLLVWVPSWRVPRVYVEDFPEVGRARVAPGGGFVWRPAGEPRPVRHALVHRWWDAERGPRYHASVAFEVPDEAAVDARVLQAATKRALSTATGALPGRGKVRAKGAARDVEGPMSLVRVALTVQGVGADAEWARRASEAFARAFAKHLERRGHGTERVAA